MQYLLAFKQYLLIKSSKNNWYETNNEHFNLIKYGLKYCFSVIYALFFGFFIFV